MIHRRRAKRRIETRNARIVDQDIDVAAAHRGGRDLFAIGDVELQRLNRLARLDRRRVSRCGIYFRGAGIAQRLDQGPAETSICSRHQNRRPADFHDSPGRRRRQAHAIPAPSAPHYSKMQTCPRPLFSDPLTFAIIPARPCRARSPKTSRRTAPLVSTLKCFAEGTMRYASLASGIAILVALLAPNAASASTKRISLARCRDRMDRQLPQQAGAFAGAGRRPCAEHTRARSANRRPQASTWLCRGRARRQSDRRPST